MTSLLLLLLRLTGETKIAARSRRLLADGHTEINERWRFIFGVARRQAGLRLRMYGSSESAAEDIDGRSAQRTNDDIAGHYDSSC